MECTNITPDVVPPSSLRLDLRVRTGRGGIQRERADVHCTYWSQDVVTEIDQVLAKQAVFTGGPGSQLVVRPGAPVTLVVVMAPTVSFTVTVNQVFVLDSPFTSFTVTNPSLTDSVRVQTFTALSGT